MKAFILLLILTTISVSQVKATDYITSSDIGKFCTNTEEKESFYGICAGFVLGVYGAENFIAELNNQKSKICVPSGTTNFDMMIMVRDYIKSHPEFDTYGASDSIYLAFIAKYPCK